MIEKTYDPLDAEWTLLYKYWEQQGYFRPKDSKNKEFFCIMLPPPNITGSLHMGHAFQQTIIDIMIRYQRMLGKCTLWQAGTDHAGIATQMIVENKISIEEGKTRYDYSRSEFIEKIWKWKKESGEIIKDQMRRLGNSIDWERERFTMDKGFSVAVKEVFLRLYKEGLIYRGKRLVNWDPKLNTAVSDLEVENKKLKDFIWYIRYPLANGVKTLDNKDYLVIATRRPESLLGDTGIAINPKDLRYKDLIGKSIVLPLVNRYIPIVSDDYVDIKKGTGCVKITPAHDFNDYEIGRRHQLPMINILTFDGHIRESAEVFDAKGNESNIYSTEIPMEFQKLERFVARKAVLSAIESLGLLEEVKLCDLTIPYGDRSGAIIEPMLTDQWYVRTDALIKPAIEAVKSNSIRFVPKQYKDIYLSWMYNIQDWCISRQLWWGHRIPAWYDEQRNVFVGHNEDTVRQENNLSINTALHQDKDVLDTWFSSSIWTFATLGWPNDTSDLHQFHPTNVIVSGFDIIFFWIARMIMMTMHFIKDKSGKPQVPFKTVYITGLVRDEKGQKMSKSKGNIIDPMDIIHGISFKELLEKRTSNMMKPQLANKIRKHTEEQFPNGIIPYGTDALRFALASLSSTGRDINWDIKRLEGCRNFCNKLWNASRFVLTNTEGQDCGFNGGKKVLSLADRWITAEFNKTVKIYREAIDNFRFDTAAGILYEFVWNQFCDWYLEFAKLIIRSGSKEELRGTRYTLITVLESLLRLAHPIIPFITESIWRHVKTIIGIDADSIMLQPFLKFDANLVDEAAFTDVKWLKQVIISVRNIRSEMKISPKKPIDLILRDCSNIVIRCVNKNKKILKTMMHLRNIIVLSSGEVGPASIIKIIDGTELLIPIAGLVDKDEELGRLTREISKVTLKISQIESNLKDRDFITSAPESIIDKERKKLISYAKAKKRLIEQQTIITSL